MFQEVFPSGFLFINNVFYVDMRKGCVDQSEIIREWASKRGLGDFPHRDMGQVSLDEIVVRLGHPEVSFSFFIYKKSIIICVTDGLRQE